MCSLQAARRLHQPPCDFARIAVLLRLFGSGRIRGKLVDFTGENEFRKRLRAILLNPALLRLVTFPRPPEKVLHFAQNKSALGNCPQGRHLKFPGAAGSY